VNPRLALLLLPVASLTPAHVRADDNRPLTVIVEQRDEDRYDVSWKIPPNLAAALVPELAPPAGCVTRAPRRWGDVFGFWGGERWQCSLPLAGGEIDIVWPPRAPSLATIVRLRRTDGGEDTLLGQPGELRIRIPEHPSRQNLFWRFLRLGIEHIATGIDHLLFVACLIFVAGTVRRTAVTITGFTLSHSITLALASLGLLSLPRGAVESVIALSILFLAVEIAKGPRDTLTWRHPVLVAAAFGFLHGFGFAAALRETGLPQQGLVGALLAFNLGIEVGQIAFAAAIFGLLKLVAHAPMSGQTTGMRRFGAYAVGILASYWLFDRLA